MDLNEWTPPPERSGNRRTCIILSILGSTLCVLILAFGIGIWFLLPNLFSSIDTWIQPQPVSEHERFNFSLFSVGAPEGAGWMYTPMKTGIAFNRLDTSEDTTTIANAWVERVDPVSNYSWKEFQEYACAYQIEPIDDNPYTEQGKDCVLWNKSSFHCVELHILYQSLDKSADPPSMRDQYTLVCRHPDFYNAMIFLNYSQQAYEGQIQEDLSQKADAFFMDMGMNYPLGTPPATFKYETSQEIESSIPGTNLAYRKPVKASRELDGFPARMAVDGLDTNWWGAGARPPQWIEIDLGGNYVIDEIRLLTSQSPAGRTIHQVLARGSATDDRYIRVHIFDGVTSDHQSLVVSQVEALNGIRYFRIETMHTPSWVGWREIEVIAGK